jgi:predicted nucleotidyltransferase component of viral defense system
MIQIEVIKNFFPAPLRDNALFNKYMTKEYLQLMVLDYLAATPYIRKIIFIGGTSIRLIKGIDRFSEDLDFDCKMLSKEEFIAMTDGVLQFLQRSGLRAVAKDHENVRLKAFRRNIYFLIWV